MAMQRVLNPMLNAEARQAELALSATAEAPDVVPA
jgi:hypothetical protein